MRPSARTLAAAAIATVLTATWTANAAATGHGPGRRNATHVITATISATGRVDLPSSVRPGDRHFRVAGASGHALELVVGKHHAGLARLVADYRQFSRTGLPVRPERDFTFVGGALTGHTVYLHLRRGTYFAFDASGTALATALVRAVHVRGRRRPLDLPRVSARLLAIGSDRWASRPTSIPDHGYLRFVNASRETQLVNLLQLRPHTTLAQVEAVLADPAADPGSVTTGRYAETGVVSPGRSEIASYTLPAGEYALISLWPDDRTGLSHAAHGMVRLITLR